MSVIRYVCVVCEETVYREEFLGRWKLPEDQAVYVDPLYSSEHKCYEKSSSDPDPECEQADFRRQLILATFPAVVADCLDYPEQFNGYSHAPVRTLRLVDAMIEQMEEIRE